MNREVKEFVKEAKRRGWIEQPNRKKHIKLRHPVTNRLLVVPCSPSDPRTMKNMSADLRRCEKEAEIRSAGSSV